MSLNTWCHANARVKVDDDHVLTPVWTSIANDFALLWGERVIALAPDVLRWELDVRPRAAFYLHPVLRGFPKDPGDVLAPEFSPSYLVAMTCREYAVDPSAGAGRGFQRSHDWMLLCLQDVIDGGGS
jgi:hypothetical protein